MLVGVAGHADNLVLAFVAGLLFRIFTRGGIIGFFLIRFCIINVILAVFNLVPIPPLDGSCVVIGFLPAYLVPKYLRLERFGFLIIFGLLYLGVLNRIIRPIVDALLRLLL